MTSRILTATVLGAMLVSQRAPGVLAESRQADQPKANFSSESQVVVLHVAVRDRKAYVSGLDEGAFRVLDNRQPQKISFFSSQDAPVTVGLLIDSSGSMGGNRDRVSAAAIGFARNSNPEDEIFVLGFNEQVIIPLPPEAPFARDIPTLRTALANAIAARGQTAVYSAVNAGLRYLDMGRYERKVLVLVSDGGDNASVMSKARILANAQASNAVIYTVGVIDPMEHDADPKFLRQLADSSGGQAFEPRNVADVGAVLQRVAQDIRNMYTIGYVPAVASRKEELRRIDVEVTLPTGRKATVRTRRAYLAGQEPDRSEGDTAEPATSRR